MIQDRTSTTLILLCRPSLFGIDMPTDGEKRDCDCCDWQASLVKTAKCHGYVFRAERQKDNSGIVGEEVFHARHA